MPCDFEHKYQQFRWKKLTCDGLVNVRQNIADIVYNCWLFAEMVSDTSAILLRCIGEHQRSFGEAKLWASVLTNRWIWESMYYFYLHMIHFMVGKLTMGNFNALTWSTPFPTVHTHGHVSPSISPAHPTLGSASSRLLIPAAGPRQISSPSNSDLLTSLN